MVAGHGRDQSAVVAALLVARLLVAEVDVAGRRRASFWPVDTASAWGSHFEGLLPCGAQRCGFGASS